MTDAASAPSKGPHVSLWVVQALLAVTFIGTGLWKLLTPILKLAAMIPWAGQVPPAFLQATAVIDLLGGVGLVLPALTRIQPWLTWLAALGCALLQVSAIVFHLSRGESANTPFNFFLVFLSLFVVWASSTIVACVALNIPAEPDRHGSTWILHRSCHWPIVQVHPWLLARPAFPSISMRCCRR